MDCLRLVRRNGFHDEVGGRTGVLARDMADHLGVTIDTVSRTFTLLESASAIRLPDARSVLLCDRAALQSEHPRRVRPCWRR